MLHPLLVARAPVAADSYGADSFGSCLAYAGGSAAACEVLLEAKVAVFVLAGRWSHLALSESDNKSRARECSESWCAHVSLRLAGFIGDAQSTWVDSPHLGCTPSSQGGRRLVQGVFRDLREMTVARLPPSCCRRVQRCKTTT